MVDWSWNLLTDAERVLARRLAVFPGGVTLAAAEQVCADALLPQAGVLPALSGLVDKSIVTAATRPYGEGPRYGMLETVRAYGLERLAEAGKADQGRVDAERAAVLLGIAHSVRGCFDESSLDAPAARDAARARLGRDAFEAAYERPTSRPRRRPDAHSHLSAHPAARARPVSRAGGNCRT